MGSWAGPSNGKLGGVRVRVSNGGLATGSWAGPGNEAIFWPFHIDLSFLPGLPVYCGIVPGCPLCM